jgi:polyphosphate:AMP phosphotransferase
MFKSLEVGNRLKKSEFNALAEPLRSKLLKLQFELAEKDHPIYFLVCGLDGAGKGTFLHRLNEWMDPRGIETNAFWEHSDEEESRPYFWRFWRQMPPKGGIGAFIDAWYAVPIMDAVNEDSSAEEFALACQQIQIFERMLTDDGAIIVKLFFHVSRDKQKMQLREEAPRNLQNPRVQASPGDWKGKYKSALKHCEQAILATDTANSPWHLIEADDPNYRDITAGQVILEALEQAGQLSKSPAASKSPNNGTDTDLPTVLSTVDLSPSLESGKYRNKLDKYQQRLQDLAWRAQKEGRSLVAVFEGWDAAGKGSAIRRVTKAIDPRLFKLVQYAAPSDEEKSHHYLWRFWRRLQRDGRATLYDRSWYGRVLVERVEGFAAEEEWRRAYNEINLFERQMDYHGCIVVKFWLHISPEEQLKRFHDREKIPRKQHKITEEDWRNREMWPDYEQAVDEMINRTSTRYAPWHVIAGNDKRHARIEILKTLCKAMEKAMD